VTEQSIAVGPLPPPAAKIPGAVVVVVLVSRRMLSLRSASFFAGLLVCVFMLVCSFLLDLVIGSTGFAKTIWVNSHQVYWLSSGLASGQTLSLSGDFAHKSAPL
jgi:hypothetical protein